MILSLWALDTNQQERKFTCWLDSDEVAFDFLNQIIANGHTLLSASITEEGQITHLPIHAFDGHFITDQLHQLKAEWTSIIPTSCMNTYTYSFGDDDDSWYQERLANVEEYILDIELIITRLHLSILALSRCKKGYTKNLVSVLGKAIGHYEAQLPYAYLNRNRLLDKCLTDSCR